jgi:hypothetical protein
VTFETLTARWKLTPANFFGRQMMLLLAAIFVPLLAFLTMGQNATIVAAVLTMASLALIRCPRCRKRVMFHRGIIAPRQACESCGWPKPGTDKSA